MSIIEKPQSDVSHILAAADKIPTLHEEYSEFEFACQQQIMGELWEKGFLLS